MKQRRCQHPAGTCARLCACTSFVRVRLWLHACACETAPCRGSAFSAACVAPPAVRRVIVRDAPVYGSLVQAPDAAARRRRLQQDPLVCRSCHGLVACPRPFLRSPQAAPLCKSATPCCAAKGGIWMQPTIVTSRAQRTVWRFVHRSKLASPCWELALPLYPQIPVLLLSCVSVGTRAIARSWTRERGSGAFCAREALCRECEKNNRL